MKDIILPIDRALLKKELNDNHFVRPTNKAGNHIYDITAHDSPNVMREIGRLRELAFRSGGGGTGEEIDVDKFDLMDKPYHQLIVWNPDAEEIVGGYRYLAGKDATIKEDGQPNFVSTHMFQFSETFNNKYLLHTTELGRAFVQPDYQTAKMGAKSLFALDNLWDGLGAIIHDKKEAQYLIGKVTIYRDYNETARNLIYAYLQRYFPDDIGLIKPKEPLKISAVAQEMADNNFAGDSQTDNYKILQKLVREQGEVVPAMFNAYIGLTSTMKTFGTGINDEFGDVYETGIMVNTADLFEDKRKRYILPYIDYLRILIENRKKLRQTKKYTRKKK